MFLLLSFYSHLHLLLFSGSKFIQFTNLRIRVDVTGKRFNRGVGLEFEIPVNYFFIEMQEL